MQGINSLIRKCSSADGRTGLAVGNGGTILQTADGGETWGARASSTSVSLLSVAISTDGRTGLAVGINGTILRTVNGEETWTAQTSGTSVTLTSVAISADGRTGLAVGWSGTILKTEDGGDTWAARISGTSARLNSTTVSVEGRTGLAVGNSGTILKTVDGGDTWRARTSGTSLAFTSMAIGTDWRTGWAVGSNSTILKTEDGGDTWAARTSGTLQTLYSVAIGIDGRTGLAVGQNGTVLRTTDGGNTWTERTSGTSIALYSVSIGSNENAALAVGDFGTILRSVDGGDTWTERTGKDDAFGATEALYSVAIGIDGRTGLAVGWNGTILKTTDGGDTWTERTSGTSEGLNSVTISIDGRTGLAVGDGGTILRTADGGDTWTEHTSGTQEFLISVAISTDGQTGLAVGDGGTILGTADGGATWTARTSGNLERLTSVAISTDSRTGLAVGWGAILLTDDGGSTWRLLNAEDDYRKYPAPWTWIVFVLAIMALLPAFQSARSTITEGIPDHLASDRPVEAGDPDPLQRRSIADTLSRFLRNENTEPPMTIAITGNWGEGKSSLMNLVRADLKSHGTRTVWFNAWHHQKEQHLFAALLQAVRDQVIPSVWTFRGLGFRRRLVVSRARRHWVWTTVALVSVVFVGMGLITDSDWIMTGTKQSVPFLHIVLSAIKPVTDGNWTIAAAQSLPFLDIDDKTSSYMNWIKRAPSSLALAISLFTAFVGCVAALKRSGVNPGRLLAAASGTFRVKAFGDQLGFRHRFGEAFNEVAQALQPNTLLILIDDLDRCRPEQVVETLEAINFLASAGPCYIVMGIAPEQVMYCVGLGFKEIAAEMAEAPDSDQEPEVWAREKRRDYARNYLEKLINIEVPIPKLTDEDAGKLAEPVRSSGGPSEIRRGLWHFVRRLAAFAGVLAVLGAGIYVGAEMYRNATTSSDQVQRPTAIPPSPTPSPGSSPTPDPNEQPTSQPPEPGGDGNGNFRRGAEGRLHWWIPFLAGLLVLAALVAVAVYAWHRQEDRIQDSPVFTKALRIWNPLVRARTNSPRQMKRFINRVRYLAMASRLADDGAAGQPSESLIVALAALQGISNSDSGTPEQSPPTHLVDLFAGQLRRLPPDQSAKVIHQQLAEILEKHEKDRIVDTIVSAVLNHRDAFPDEVLAEGMVSRFHKMASGIVVR